MKMRVAPSRVFALFLAVCALSLSSSCKKRPAASPSDVDFGSGEHKWLGDAAFERACAEPGVLCPPSKTLMRKDGKEAYTYGDLVAFSGDFFEKPNDIYDKAENLLGRFSNKVYVKSHFEKQVEAINRMYHGDHDASYPSNTVGVALSIPQYGILALNNDVHFGWHNMVAYVEHHQSAINLAKEAHALRKSDAQAAQLKLVHALFVNAFADHFLTDAFAAGHIRVPRAQLKSWSVTKRHTSSLSGTIAKVVHDFDGKISKHYPVGLNVMNAAGNVWASRVDAELFIRLEGDAQAVDLPVKAVILSLMDIFDAYETGKEPEGTFPAAMLAPYVDVTREMGLAARFRSLSAADVQEISASKDWFSKVPFFTKVTPKHITDLTTDLPAIMADFAKQVKLHAAANPEIKRRLPSAYIDYFSTIE